MYICEPIATTLRVVVSMEYHGCRDTPIFRVKNVMIYSIKCLGEVKVYSRTYSSFEILSTRHVSASSSEWLQWNPNWCWYSNWYFFTNDNKWLYIRPSRIFGEKKGSTFTGREIENTMGSFDLNNGITFATLFHEKNVCDRQTWYRYKTEKSMTDYSCFY